jgi:hypothetical protein
MFKKTILILLFISLFNINITWVLANDEPGYTQFRLVDAWTFNEYRYKITDEFFNFRNKYEIDWKINTDSANKILNYATTGYKYLPDSLINKNLLNYLKTSIERWIKYPNNTSNYSSIVEDIEKYLENTNIGAIKWKVEAFPSSWNAPLNVTLRWSVTDPTWTPIPSYNYTWWINENWKRKVLWNWLSLNYLFKEEWNFSVFLDVKSSHKNALWNIDVLSFSSRADIVVKEKIASLIIKVNSLNLRNSNELKFTPEEAKYW